MAKGDEAKRKFVEYLNHGGVTEMSKKLFNYLHGVSSPDIAIKPVRTALNLTQEQFARELHVSVATIRRWEKEKSKPSPLAKESIREMARRKGLIE